MSEPKKILFLTSLKERVETFWNEECEKKCKEYNFTVDVPAMNGDCPEINWAEILPEYDALVTTWSSPVCSKEFLAPAKNVKVIGHCAGSAAAVTDDTTFETSVQVTTANFLMAESVAQWSLLATLLAQRPLGKYASLRKGEKMTWNPWQFIGDLRSMTIGLWGMGDVSTHLLRFLAPLKPAEILVCSSHASEEELAKYNARKVSLDELLAESDIFHCLVGVTRDNFRRIGKREFSLMKEGAVFINAGRSKLCCPDSLVEALKNNRIRAILDVFEGEPLPDNSPLYELDNVIMTPHEAGFPGRPRFFPFILDEFDRFFKGEKMLAEINRSRQQTMTREGMRSR